ncbi:gene transfer agent family protein [Oryzicola mucosus]|uniref:Gene transfer agent family protein n=1 Tax=Oryzicola mucosus TaxID=2767425 RepID=A0A8J6PV84_9HYPH|nr:gene transfer agent family protein [Oryzicola mucosus]MBD0416504.1 gene transfer agent family protein [Oryzicola mucosus]
MAKTIKLPFAGDMRSFRLGIGELREMQEKCNAGPATVLARLMSFQPQAADALRPRPENYQLGEADPDFIADQNIFALTRQIGGDWRVDDVREPIRLGLIGAGTTTTEAVGLVMRYIDQADEWTSNIGLSASILLHALMGEQDDKVGKSAAETTETKATGA